MGILARLLPLALLAACAGRPPSIAPRAPYEPVARALETWIEREIADKKIPGLSIALVDDQTIVWARGFGGATAESIHRVGSVSKLLTDVAIMRQVERGAMDLDAPVTEVLPDFAFQGVTLRHLMAHRAGLVREPPAGNYFDAAPTSLAGTVASLNGTSPVYPVGARMKYSNAGIAVVGLALERSLGRPFAECIRREVLDPAGMDRSDFTPKVPAAPAVMWTSFGREFPAPTFELGMAPAGSLYAPVTDLARFMSVLFAGGGNLLKPESLARMWTPQFTDRKTGVGLGFFVGELEGKRTVGHGGAIYGFATTLKALPDAKLGVAVAATKDGANSVTDRIGDIALRMMLAAREGKPLPAIDQPTRLTSEETRRLAGRYRDMDLVQSAGRLYLHRPGGEVRVELRKYGTDLIVDDCLDYGRRIVPPAQRLPDAKPAPAPDRWRGLIGEYGWDHNVMLILERDGKLYSLIEWFYLYPLTEESPDVFSFPDYGLYHGEKLLFARGKHVTAASVVFPLRAAAGDTFRITPQRPLEELRREAAAASPPVERGDFRESDLVEVTSLDPSVKLDIRYAGTRNFLSAPMYASAKAYLQRPAAAALVRAHRALEREGYGVLIHDGYRPWAVTKVFWEATPEPQRLFVADPTQGSRHNRGCAVDLTLYDRATGKVVDMVGGYDEMSDRSFPDYPGGSSLQRWHRDLLRRAMEAEGFAVYETEWWHFDFGEWRKYPILNEPFERLGP